MKKNKAKTNQKKAQEEQPEVMVYPPQPHIAVTEKIIEEKFSKKKKKKMKSEFLNEEMLENMTIRVTLTKTLKILVPVGSFVICQHACKFSFVFDLF